MKTFTVELSVVGLKFRMKKDVQRVVAGMVPFNVEIERDPGNQWDANAIKVTIADPKLGELDGKFIGFFRRGVASQLAAKLDDGEIEPDTFIITAIYADDGEADCKATFLKTDLFKPS